MGTLVLRRPIPSAAKRLAMACLVLGGMAWDLVSRRKVLETLSETPQKWSGPS